MQSEAVTAGRCSAPRRLVIEELLKDPLKPTKKKKQPLDFETREPENQMFARTTHLGLLGLITAAPCDTLTT